ncbi:MAG TPA: S8/S53 family peptidase [Ktedonobacteraceae bacterium]|nr:S8/S53 family peptidase [Ktedonobacteraceae bacterium]
MNELNSFMHNAFWVANEVSFMFAPQLLGPIEDMNQSLNLQDFAAFLNDRGFRVSNWNAPNPSNQADVPDSPAYYEFPDVQVILPNTTPRATNTVIAGFVQFEDLLADEHASQQDGQMGQGPTDLSRTSVARLVNLVNGHQQKLYNGEERLRDGTQLGAIPIVAAAPNWYCGASNGVINPLDQVTTGCPLTPPIPISSEATCASSSGLWPIQLPELPRLLKKMSGDGVTVFVLDSLPSRKDIRRAASAAGEHNLLLLDLLNNVRFTYPTLPEVIDRAGSQQPVTGKDIEGRAVGFRMPDHGLFVAGIIRDIAPGAHVECIRVLNDYCAGTTKILMGQLREILDRIQVGDLKGRDVVINMSLEIPDNEDVYTSDIDLHLARLGLFCALQSLSQRGVILVASAGNEGDMRYMKPKGMHPPALYPSAFAYPPGKGVENMIPVGAVNDQQEIASYSCDPGPRGVLTYGGDVPSDSAIFEDVTTHVTEVDRHQIDAAIGVYTQLSYPALSFYDPEATYPAPNAHAWAYWIGTSFATPIISALVARALELQRRVPAMAFAKPITESIISYATKNRVSWPVDNRDGSRSIQRPMVLAQQCCPPKRRYQRRDAQVQVQAEPEQEPAIAVAVAGAIPSDH